MKTQNNNFEIDKLITYYQNLPHQKKTTINLIVGIFVVLFTVSMVYQFGEKVGEFWYHITH